MDFDYVVFPAIIFVVGVLLIWLSVRRFRSLSSKSYRTWRKVVERIVLSVVVLLVAVLAGSSAYNAIVLHHFWATNQPPRRFLLRQWPQDAHHLHR